MLQLDDSVNAATLEVDHFCPKIFPFCWAVGVNAQYAAARQVDMSAGIAAAAVAAFMTNNMQSSYATQPTAQRAERSTEYRLGDPIPVSAFQPIQSQEQINAAYGQPAPAQSQRTDATPSYGYRMAEQNAWRPGVTDNLGNLFNSYTTTQTDSAWQSFKPSTTQEERHSQIYKLEHSPLQQGKPQFDQIHSTLREWLNEQADYASRMHARQEDQLAKMHARQEDQLAKMDLLRKSLCNGSSEPPAQPAQAATAVGIIATAQRVEPDKISNKAHATSKSCKPETTSEFRSSCGTDLDLMYQRV